MGTACAATAVILTGQLRDLGEPLCWPRHHCLTVVVRDWLLGWRLVRHGLDDSHRRVWADLAALEAALAGPLACAARCPHAGAGLGAVNNPGHAATCDQLLHAVRLLDGLEQLGKLRVAGTEPAPELRRRLEELLRRVRPRPAWPIDAGTQDALEAAALLVADRELTTLESCTQDCTPI